jgi:shikimate kinase/3-dehydroquinate synthase
MPDPRGIVLIGLPGSGKSTVGRLVAERLGRPFRDTDEMIAQRCGMPAHEYLRQHGEEAFRSLERFVVDEACREAGSVVATGGGALIDPLNRWALWAHGPALSLEADDAVLLRRLAADATTPRPLLDGEPAARLAALRTERAPFYRAADVAITADHDAPLVADDVLAAAALPMPDGRRLYDAIEPRNHVIGPSHARVVLGRDLGSIAGEVLAVVGGSPSVVVDRRVMHLVPPAARCLPIAGGERAKRLRSLERILGWLAENGAERDDPLVAVGGGTVGDLAGLAAALYGRGVPLVSVPTTWLAQLDASLGGKVAVDLPAGKNLVGAFWPAWAVLADVVALRTLPRARLRDGLAEAVKAAVIGDPALWRLIAERGRGALRDDEPARYAITERAARLKLAVVARDPFEHGERRVLNLGHTIGHALEVEAGYRLAHGPAVALGMRAVAAIAAERGGDPRFPATLDEMLAGLGFRLRHRFDPVTVRRAMSRDKKRAGGRQRWLLPMGIGSVVEVDDVTDVELAGALRAIGQD